MRRPQVRLVIRCCDLMLMKRTGIHDGIICTGQSLLYFPIHGSEQLALKIHGKFTDDIFRTYLFMFLFLL
jgi:hypothetical protein